MTDAITSIPLSKLTLWSGNVRKTAASGSGIPQCAGPPHELVEHGFGGTGAAVLILGLARGVEMRPYRVEADRVPNSDRMQFGEHLTEMLDGMQASRDASVGNQSDRFGALFFRMPIG